MPSQQHGAHCKKVIEYILSIWPNFNKKMNKSIIVLPEHYFIYKSILKNYYKWFIENPSGIFEKCSGEDFL